MKSCVAAGFALALAACQRGEPSPTTDEQYRADIVSLCDSMHLSGADKGPQDEAWATQAIWLARNTKTSAAHDFFVKIKPLEGDARAHALDDEARRVGLRGCALAAEWRH